MDSENITRKFNLKYTPFFILRVIAILLPIVILLQYSELFSGYILENEIPSSYYQNMMNDEVAHYLIHFGVTLLAVGFAISMLTLAPENLQKRRSPLNIIPGSIALIGGCMYIVGLELMVQFVKKSYALDDYRGYFVEKFHFTEYSAIFYSILGLLLIIVPIFTRIAKIGERYVEDKKQFQNKLFLNKDMIAKQNLLKIFISIGIVLVIFYECFLWGNMFLEFYPTSRLCFILVPLSYCIVIIMLMFCFDRREVYRYLTTEKRSFDPLLPFLLIISILNTSFFLLSVLLSHRNVTMSFSIFESEITMSNFIFGAPFLQIIYNFIVPLFYIVILFFAMEMHSNESKTKLSKSSLLAMIPQILAILFNLVSTIIIISYKSLVTIPGSSVKVVMPSSTFGTITSVIYYSAAAISSIGFSIAMIYWIIKLFKIKPKMSIEENIEEYKEEIEEENIKQ